MNSKWTILAVLIFALMCFGTGCGTKAAPSASSGFQAPAASQDHSSDSALESEDEQEIILAEFDHMLQSGADEKEAIQEILKNAPILSAENTSKMVLCFEDYQNEKVAEGELISSDLVKLIQTSLKEPYQEKMINDVEKIDSPELKSAVQGLLDRGYQIIVPEGNYQAVINYDVYKNFEAFVTPDIRDYTEIKASESENRMSEDAGIIIPIREVFNRARACESFLERYPDSSRLAQIKSMYNGYVDAFFYGQDNTPAFDSATNRLHQEFLDTYREAALDSTDSALARAASDYLSILEKNHDQLTDTVKTYRETMISTLKGTNP